MNRLLSRVFGGTEGLSVGQKAQQRALLKGAQQCKWSGWDRQPKGSIKDAEEPAVYSTRSRQVRDERSEIYNWFLHRREMKRQ